MTDSVMIVRLPFILFWLLTSTCVIGAKQLIIKDVGPSLPALVSYKIIHKDFNDESSNVYLAQTHDLHTSADQKHLSNSAEFNKIAAKQSPISFLAYCVATNKIVPNSSQAANLKRFQKKIPANSKDSVELRQLPSGGVAAQATSPGRVPGSKAVYEKQIDIRGKTLQSTKTTYDPSGNIVHVKDKLNGGTF